MSVAQVRWVSSGAWMPPEARRCSANNVPTTVPARTSATLRVATVASAYTAVDFSTGWRGPTAAYTAPRKNTSSAAPLASVVNRTRGLEPSSANRNMLHRAVFSTGIFRATRAPA
jgi:hypothetical protein